MRSEGGARSLTITGNDVDDAFGESCFLDQLRKFHRANGSLLGGLENDSVTGSERRRELPGRHQEGKVPGNDLAANTDRLTQGVVEHLAGHGNRFTFDLRGPAGEVLKVLDHLRQIDIERLFDRLSVISSFQRGKLAGVLLEQLRKLVKQAATITRAHFGPFTFKRTPRGRYRFVDVGFVGFGDFSKRLTRRRIRRLESFSRFRIDPLAVDK